jgi:hypothetical protein
VLCEIKKILTIIHHCPESSSRNCQGNGDGGRKLKIFRRGLTRRTFKTLTFMLPRLSSRG